MQTIKVSRTVIIKNNKLLVMYRKKFKEYVLPGGKIDVNETKEEAAVRETKEELGVDVEIVKELSMEEHVVKDKKYIEYNFLSKLKDKQIPKIMEPESYRDFKWIDLNELDKLPLPEYLKTFLKKYAETGIRTQISKGNRLSRPALYQVKRSRQ